MRCCLCGSKLDPFWCKFCGHAFCPTCRRKPLYRTQAALKQYLLKEPPRFCSHW